MATNNGSEDVNDFLLRIRELGDQRDREDEERTRKLEEEILQGRKERQARRAERARSISPTKELSSDAGTPNSVRSTAGDTICEGIPKSPVVFGLPKAIPGESSKDVLKSPREGPSNGNRSSTPRVLPQPPSKPATFADSSSGTAVPPSRSGTLSWQKRPTSRGSTGQRARPLSQIAAENSTSRSPRASAEPPPTGEREMSREQFADSLRSKDPAWFSQTQERGLGSAAYRRNQEESTPNTASFAGSMRLPGMSREARESAMEPERQGSPVSESVRSISPSRTDSLRGTSIRQSQYTKSTSMSSSDGSRPPIPTFASASFEPAASDVSSRGRDPLSSRGMAMSPSQGRISPERVDRPASPTKGLGGFVQSAMLKRSDSVNKRWSAQPGTGLSRGNSIVSNRGGYSMPSLNTPKEQISLTQSREASPLSSSRPGSSHGPATFVRLGKDNDKPSFPSSGDVARQPPGLEVEPVKLVRSHEVLPSNVPQPVEGMELVSATQNSPPSSPSKRWSPTKSSWLENAINKPDSPKPKMPPPQQPSWMTNLNQSKQQQRGSVDLGRGGSFKDVPTGGLLRSPPMGAANKGPSIGGLPPGFNARATPNPKSSTDDRFLELSGNQMGKVDDKDKGELTSEAKPESAHTRQPMDSASTEAEVITGGNSPRPSKDVRMPTAGMGRNQEASPRSPKLKPETPPKKDFRSNLKPRQTSAEKKSAEDPEFRNVFGKLKRTQTQNYVAPDELKDNILRGKAGLAATGGPKKTERRDEFKESLLKQKEAMKAGPPPTVGRKPSTGESIKDQTSTPEALAKRNGLTKSDSNPNMPRTNATESKQQPEALAKFNSLRGKPLSTSSEIPLRDAVQAQKSPSINDRLGSDFNSSLANVLSRGPAAPSGSGSSTRKTRLEDSIVDDVTRGQYSAPEAAEGSQLTHMTKSRARGPKRRLPTTPAGSEERKGEKTLSPATVNAMLPSLTSHQLESRSKPQDDIPSSPMIIEPEPQPHPVDSISGNLRKPSQPQPPRKPSLNINKPENSSPVPSDIKNVPTRAESPRIVSPPPIKPKPSSPEAERVRKPLSSTPEIINIPSRTPSAQNHRDKLTEPQRRDFRAQSTPQEENPSPSVSGAAASWTPSVGEEQPTQSRALSPIKLQTGKNEEAAMQDSGLIFRKETPIGLGIGTVKPEARAYAPAMRDLPTPPLASPKSPPIPAKKPPSVVIRVASNNKATEPLFNGHGSPTSHTPEAARLFAELFDESLTTKINVNIDTPAVLASRASTSEPDKIRTLRKQLWEVTPGGKLISVSSDQSHILFEDGLYICHHVFGSVNGTRTTEVYLWCGDGVATPAVDDAQIFARKEAKDHGGKLILLQQGKETSGFFQALGGIVITRHGQSDRASSRYMLCGRRHVGQVAFDEVDFSPQSLCGGYPYIISSGSGKVHLWKGIGSGIDELGCARLIGMDLGVRGEIQEVDEGKEPEAFWRLFRTGGQQRPRNTSPASSRHWHLKPSTEQYSTRLYQIDIEAPRPKSSSSFWVRRGSAPTSTPTDENTAKWNAVIKEIAPFAQSDVFHDGVFVLDTFFEVFVIVPSFPSTSLLLPSFRTACLFAQEYAILAASSANENRPFVPQGFVLLLGVGRDAVPEGVRCAFRKWDAGKVRGCRVLGLVDSLEVLTTASGKV
ncbi:MAG: hypothetical protein Q9207_000909 [Kuettlingeria erythrocarpa]